MDLQLTGKRAIVCGASQGLGLACANALAAEGADVVINSRDSEKLNKAAAQIRDATGRSVQVCAADITQDDDRARLIESAPDSDILINNAGGPPPGDFRNWTQQDWMDALTLNMLAAIDLTRRVIDGMAARGFGRVLNITSSAVKAPIGILGLSNGARSGLTGFMSGLAREVAPQGVTINNLLPGPFDTDRLRGAHQAFADAKGYRSRRCAAAGDGRQPGATLRPTGRIRRIVCVRVQSTCGVHECPEFVAGWWGLCRHVLGFTCGGAFRAAYVCSRQWAWSQRVALPRPAPPSRRHRQHPKLNADRTFCGLSPTTWVPAISALMGRRTFPTPNIDALARSGTRFTNGYVTGPICSPSRAGFMTGRYQARFGHDFNPRNNVGVAGYLPLTERTIAARMQDVGYQTALIGKWDLGYADHYHPLDRGFGRSFGWDVSSSYILEAHPGDILIPVKEPTEYTAKVLQGERALYRGRTPIAPRGYLTELVTAETTDFLRHRDASTPFFAVVTHYAPHLPLQATGKYLSRVGHIKSEVGRVQAAMIVALDDSVGEIVRALRETGQADNTIIAFFSDNGCPSYLQGGCSNAPFSGFKRYLSEGGIHVPMIVVDPRKQIPPGDNTTPVTSLDMGASSVAAAGGDLRGLEGTDLGSLDDRRAAPWRDRPLFWRGGTTFAVRRGDWKLMHITEKSGVTRDLLFNLTRDPGETTDLAAAHPDKVKALLAEYADWERGNQPPAYEGRTIVRPISGVDAIITF